jgi:hypothetical protein
MNSPARAENLSVRENLVSIALPPTAVGGPKSPAAKAKSKLIEFQERRSNPARRTREVLFRITPQHDGKCYSGVLTFVKGADAGARHAQ